jgi:DNA-binding winged helix-turn-helix (wHTH) protein
MLHQDSKSELRLLIVGDYLFEPRAGLLSGPTGAHHICSRLSALLSFLIEHSSQIVERDLLVDELWHDDPHGSRYLTQYVGRLRQYFDDKASIARYIETIPKRGYRLVAPVYGSTRKPESVQAAVLPHREALSGKRIVRLVREFRDRKVCRSLVIYSLVVWLVFQVTEIVQEALRLPDWTLSLVVVLGILGFPIAAVLSWVFDITPDGVIRGRRQDTHPCVPGPRRRHELVLDYALVLVSVVILGWLTMTSFGVEFSGDAYAQPPAQVTPEVKALIEDGVCEAG